MSTSKTTRRQAGLNWPVGWAVRAGSVLGGVSAVLLWGAFALNCARGEIVTLTPVADADIEQSHANSNSGNATSMASGELGFSAGTELRRAVLRFDLAGQVPPGAVINSVALTVVVVRVPSAPANSAFDLRRLLQPWAEAAVTWNARLASVPWQTPGAEGATDSAGTASASVFVSGVGPYTFAAAPNLLADVQAWVNDASSNFGWLLVSEGEGTPFTARRFGTREDPVNAPTLVIDYSLPAPVILTQPQSQTVQVGGTASFSVSASGTPPLSYQWLFFGNAIPGATDSTLSLSNVQTNDAGDYNVVVSDQNGSTNSQVATLTVSPLPVPVVSFVTPTNGTRIPVLSELLVTAQATEPNGAISQIQVLLDGSVLGMSTNSPFSLVLTNPTPGTHLLTAVALDGFGTFGSNTISFFVFAPASVTLTQPAPGSTFPFGTNVTVAATLAPGGARVTNVLFLADGGAIGQSAISPFSILWRPAQPQSYALTAVALDEFGQSTTSSVVLVRIFLPETTHSSLTITQSPRDFSRLTSPSVLLAGTASDNVGLDHIEFQINDGPFQRAQGTNFWTAQLTLAPGINSIRIRSVDLAGNTSALATRFFTFVVSAPLSVEFTAGGTVTPDLDGHLLELGKIYRITARPGPGQLFAGWTGAPNSNNAALNFQMSSNLALVARFVPNPFPPVAGTYTGIFLDTNNVAAESSGFLTLRLDRLGSFSGRLGMNGASHSFHGRFSPPGEATVPVLRRAHAPVVLALQVDLSEGADALRGFATNAVGTNVLSSALLARRNIFSSTHPALQQGQRGFLLENTAPGGAGVVGTGQARLGSAGGARVLAVLTNSSKFSLSSALAADGTVPFYGSLRGGSELLIGWLLFPTQPAGSAAGSLFWVVPGTNGFTRILGVAPATP